MHSPQSELRATQLLFLGATGRRIPHSLSAAGSPTSSAAAANARPSAAANRAAAAEACRAKKIVQVLKECFDANIIEKTVLRFSSLKLCEVK